MQHARSRVRQSRIGLSAVQRTRIAAGDQSAEVLIGSTCGNICEVHWISKVAFGTVKEPGVAVLRVCLLGLMEVHLDDKPLPRPPTVKSQALLAYLILHHGRPQPRERLAALFWGDSPDEKARRSLSTAIWHIHRCLPEPCRLVTDGQTVRLELGCKIWLDVQAFEELAQRSDLDSLRSSVELYRGELLEGFYDDWIIPERTRLEGCLLETLARLMNVEEKQGGYAKAQALALRLLEIDPLNEEAHRLVMRACYRLGRRKAALRQYELCRALLREELGVGPMPETTALYRAILKGRLD